MARIIGTPGADSLAGSAEADLLLGRGGDDQLDGLGGADLVLGGVGNDRIFGESSASGLPYPPPPGGDDVLLGGTGNDTIIGGSRPGDPQDGQDLILGGPGNDSLRMAAAAPTRCWAARATTLSRTPPSPSVGRGMTESSPRWAAIRCWAATAMT